MKVYFIGAGPGDPELLTLRGRDLIARCPLVLYAGSLVPKAVVAHARADADERHKGKDAQKYYVRQVIPVSARTV